ncbi:MAG: LysR family transcriptional regulator [Oscillospiraceae bacterium]|nr:LysR family transcriptional regulator [Oscillospiraceae bacterium]
MKGAVIINEVNITFQQIETFLTVAKHLSLSKAAEAMYVSQPALSKTLQRFEEGVGFPLFTRSNQGISLTEEGRTLYLTVKPMYEQVTRVVLSIRSAAGAARRVLHIGVVLDYDASEEFRPMKALVAEFEKRRPDITVLETMFGERDLRQSLEFGNIDLAFAPAAAMESSPSVAVRPLGKMDTYLIMSDKHPMASREAPDFAALGSEVFYSLPLTDSATDARAAAARCKRLGFAPRSVEFPPNSQTLLHAVRLGKGMSISRAYPELTQGEGIKRFQVPPELCGQEYAVVAYRTDRLSREARAFLDMIPGNAEPAREMAGK